MLRKASPIECVPLAQAVTVLVQIPFAPIRKATFPAAIFTIANGTNIGDTRAGPFLSIFIT